MTTIHPSTLPPAHLRFVERLLGSLPSDPRIVGIAAGGSWITNTMDAFSDLDLVIVAAPDTYASVLLDRRALASQCGTLLSAFTGEHVGEPRLLICLYDEPLLHVDLKFVSLDDVATRVEDPAVLWQRGQMLTQALGGEPAQYPQPQAQWIEDRFWIWVHYGAGKIGRGELFEAIDFLAWLRATVLGPLALQRAGARPQGVRKLEQCAPAFANALRSTVAAYDPASCVRALRACVALYLEVRPGAAELQADHRTEAAALRYLDEIERQLPSA